jgi:DMSO/TMAO reductase YedYZ molybdopterin-dependent catalytic subunit
MAGTGLSNESDYFEDRDEQLAWRLRRDRGLSRRELLRLGAAGSLVLATGGVLRQPASAAGADPPSGPIVKPLPPEWFTPIGTNAEMKWEAMQGQGYLTPSARFFVRNHTSTPLIDAMTWNLRVFGTGLRRQEGVTLTYRDLLRLPSRTVDAFVECAGNGRSFFGTQQGTPAAGSQWKLGAVGVAQWRGVPLSEVLERAGISRRAVDVMPQGLDPTVVTNGVDTGHVRRPLSAEKALDDVLIAYEMNGEPLPPDHGFPARLIVPGWVGIASTKWVGQIEVSDQPLFSPWNTTQYRMVGPTYPADAPPLTKQQVKSAFELPWGASVPAGQRLTLHGRSWSGDEPIRRVDVRVNDPAAVTDTSILSDYRHDHHHPADGWRRARLNGPNLPHAWVRWTIDWQPRAAGSYELLARATDRAGTTQPDTVPFNTGGYQFWAVVRHPVTAG